LQIAAAIDGAVLSAESFLLRFLSEQNDDRLLIVNFGRRHRLVPAPEPLLAPPPGCEWELLWSSESARYDGPGTVDIATDEEWILPAEAAFVLRPRLRIKPRKKPKKR
jgi:maltooligosyltrehalose trehalohydrolase